MDEEESERLVVPKKPGNPPKGTRWREGVARNTEPSEGTMSETPSPSSISTKQGRIAELARQMPDQALSSLSRHMDLAWLREAWRLTRKGGAAGVDGQTAQDYEANLEGNLQALLDRAKSGTYRAPPVRRVHIPKGDGATRPIGIPTLEDKILQRAVVMLLEPVYEQDFMPFSYGFRPGRSAHDALQDLQQVLFEMDGGWVLDVDIQAFFDSLDRRVLRDLLRQRVVDGVVVRLVGKWLNAGVLEGGVVTRSEQGTPQGGVISPLLANIYLHEVLDRWWADEVQPRLNGRAHLIRYADDFVMVFASEADARRVQAVLPKRMARFGLTLHPDKTRLLPFRRPDRKRRGPDGEEPDPGSFDFLGFTHLWEKSRKGRWVPKQRTAKSRFTRALKAISAWCRTHRHAPIALQAKSLGQKLNGHYWYFGVTGNQRALARFAFEVARIWKKWLGRRSQRSYVNKERFRAIVRQNPLPPPRAYRSTYRT